MFATTMKHSDATPNHEKVRKFLKIIIFCYEISFNSRQVNKMVKHTQTIRRLLQTSCLGVFDHFVELAL